MMDKINAASDYIKAKLNFQPEIGLILGTGLNNLAEMVKDPIIIPYKEIPELPVSTAPSHAGRIVAGELAGKKVLFFQGRLHYYEGYRMDQVIMPVRIMSVLGIKYLFVTNAAGSLNETLLPGDVVLLKDHINFMGTNPLIGRNLEEFGERFPSMNEPYTSHLREKAEKISDKLGLDLKSGVYCAVSGPSLETRSECLMFQAAGADLVGMSTAPEVIIAVHCGIEVLGISIVTNMSNIFHNQVHSQEEIRENAAKARKKLEILFIDILKEI
jgi:purine-nucleoside phosphorylase